MANSLTYLLLFVFPLTKYVLGAFHSTKTSALNIQLLPVANGTAYSKISKRGKHNTVENFFPNVFLPFNFAPGISRIFGWIVHLWEIQQFLEFLGTYPGNFCTICRCSQIFESFGWMESALYLESRLVKMQQRWHRNQNILFSLQRGT